MNARQTISALACLAVASCLPNGSTTPDPFAAHDGVEGEGVLGEWVQSGLLKREYILGTPPDMQDGRTYPLLIVMHGAGSSAEGLRRWIDPDQATRSAGFIAAYPQGLAASWNIGCGSCTPAGYEGVDDIRFIHNLIDHLSDELPVDTARVFVAGQSLGAQFAHYYACESDRPAAGIAAISGLWLRRTGVACDPAGPLPVLMIHGDEDHILPWEGPRNNISAYSMPEALERWYELLECTFDPVVVEHPDLAGDGTSVQSTTVTGCVDGTSIELHRIRGGGHGWPGPAVQHVPQLGPHSSNLDGLTEILRFLRPYAG